MEHKDDSGSHGRRAMTGPATASGQGRRERAGEVPAWAEEAVASGDVEGMRRALRSAVRERRRAERALAAERRRQRALLDAMPGLVMARGSGNVIVFANRIVRERLGGDPTGRCCRDVLTDCQGECGDCPPSGADAAGRSWVLSAGGSVFQMASFPCRGHDGSCLVLDIGTDATARIRAEEGVRVYSRKLDLCRRELREFTAAVARDVQEPSEAIVALCGRLAGRPSPDLRSGLDRVEATARRMSAMAAALLSYLDLTEQVEPFGPADLGLIAREAMSDLQPLIDRRNGSVEIGALPTVEADPGQMRVLFRSLVGAILRQQSEPRIRIDGQRCARPEDRQGAEPPAKIRVQIRVQDLIRDQLQDHSLDGPEDLPGAAGAQPWPAERLGNLLAGGPQGIGLAVCRRIVERHGGTLAAWGGYGGGSRYTFFLPERQRGMSVKTV